MERWTAEEARKVLQQWQQSGQSAEGYARAHGFSAQRLWWWKKRLGEPKSAQQRQVGIAKLVPAVLRSAGASFAAQGVSIRVTAGVSVDVDASCVSPSWVAELVTELARK